MKTVRRLGAAGALCVGILWFAGLVVFVTTQPRIVVSPPQEAAGRGRLAPTPPQVEVSSVEWAGRFHPAYVLDRWARPSESAKWVSATHDERPWIRLTFPRPRVVDSVTLALGGVAESPETTMRNYAIACRLSGKVVRATSVVDNRQASPTHSLACPRADGVEVAFDTEPGTPRSVVRLYELSVNGR